MNEANVPWEEAVVETFDKKDLQRLLKDHHKLLILYGFANAVSTILDRDLLLNEAMNVVFGLVNAERGAIFLIDPKSGKLIEAASRSRESGDKKSDAILNNAIIEKMIREGKTILTADAMNDSRFKTYDSIKHQKIRSCLCIPLESQHHILGFLYIDHRQKAGSFSKEESTLLTGILSQTAVAIENIESVRSLKEERKRVERILKALPVAIVSITQEGEISFVNPKAEKLFDVPANHCVSYSYQSFLKVQGLDPLLRLITHALQEGEAVAPKEIACGKGEKKLLLLVNIVPLREGLVQKGVLVALEDITEKRKLEYDIQNAEKLTAIGEMTAGLVHEINNPLNIISGRAQLLLLDNGKDPEATKAAKIIREQVDRASSITEKLLNFARQRMPQLQPISLEEVIRHFLETMEGQFSAKHVTVEEKYEETPIWVIGDSEQLEEVFMNLGWNAIQAMPQGGRITIEAHSEGEYANIRFSDTGVGIPEEHLKKLFLPFFTTKSHGTGLGLSIAHGVVKNHRGTLEVESQEGKGTTFLLTLPLKEEADT